MTKKFISFRIIAKIWRNKQVFGAIIVEFFHSIMALIGMVGVRNDFPPSLSKAEEEELTSRLSEGSEEARKELIERNLRLVAHIAKKYTTKERDSDDLISIGTIGLIKAINTFKLEKGRSVAAYAARCIENEMLMAIRAERKQRSEVPLSEPIGTDKEGNEITLADILSGDEDVCLSAEQREENRILYRAVHEALSERERIVIKMRYGLGSRGYAQREVGEQLGISRSYVSRIEKKALKKLNSYMLGHGMSARN